jgi:predicted enzyme related to lactoylglutathione lyase
VTFPIRNIVIDCNDVDAMAAFWAEVTGYRPKRLSDIYTSLRAPEGDGLRLLLQRVTEPKSVKTRIHLDLTAADIEDAARKLESIGARRLARYEELGEEWIVMADVEGNEFCVCSG